MKKEIKKQIKEDEFVSTVTHVVRFFETHHKTMAVAGAGVLAIVVLFFGLRYLRAQSLQKESRVVSELLSLRAEADKDPQKLADLERTAGDGKFERFGYILLGTYWMDNGDLDKAEAALRKIKAVPRDLTYAQAQDLLGQIAVLRKDYDGAVKIYDALEKTGVRAYAPDAILFHKAEALEKKGDRAGALAVYKKLQETYSQTYFGYDASFKVRKLEAGS
jgi:predicted negative regulator of RcsB-dependent stress response